MVRPLCRFHARIFPSASPNQLSSGGGLLPALNTAEIVMNNRRGCKEKLPHMDMDEHCRSQTLPLLLSHTGVSDEIKVNAPDEPNKARIIAFSVWGILRLGLE